MRRVAPELGQAFSELREAEGLSLVDVYRRGRELEELYQLAETLTELDERATMWRIRHLKVVERIIGGEVVGTQGTPVELLGGLPTAVLPGALEGPEHADRAARRRRAELRGLPPAALGRRELRADRASARRRFTSIVAAARSASRATAGSTSRCGTGAVALGRRGPVRTYRPRHLRRSARESARAAGGGGARHPLRRGRRRGAAVRGRGVRRGRLGLRADLRARPRARGSRAGAGRAPGGRLAFTAWPADAFARARARAGRLRPRGRGRPRWGGEEHVRELLGDAFELEFADGEWPRG